MIMNRKMTSMPTRQQALPGRSRPMPVPATHFVNGNPLKGPWPGHLQQAVFGLGCFWGAERRFWETDGVYSTAAGYAGGITPNPTYEEVCSGMTGHTEVVQVVFDPDVVGFGKLLRIFWEAHDPTQGMRQGNDRGTQYRSAIYTLNDAQQAAARQSSPNKVLYSRHPHRFPFFYPCPTDKKAFGRFTREGFLTP